MADLRSTGLYAKFHVRRADLQHLPGRKHDRCDYFVLDLTHDPFAMAAIEAYANACEREYPVLSADLKVKVNLAKSYPAESRRFQPQDGK